MNEQAIQKLGDDWRAAFMAKDVEKMMTAYHEDVTVDNMTVPMLGLKKSALPAVFGSYFEGNEDLKSEQVSLKVAGDFSVTEWRASMKRVGPSPIMGTQGIGSTIHMVGVALQTFKDGKIFKETVYSQFLDKSSA